MAAMKQLPLLQVLDFAIGTPEVGCLNLNMLWACIKRLIIHSGAENILVDTEELGFPEEFDFGGGGGKAVKNKANEVWSLLKVKKRMEANKEGLDRLYELLSDMVNGETNLVTWGKLDQFLHVGQEETHFNIEKTMRNLEDAKIIYKDDDKKIKAIEEQQDHIMRRKERFMAQDGRQTAQQTRKSIFVGDGDETNDSSSEGKNSENTRQSGRSRSQEANGRSKSEADSDEHVGSDEKVGTPSGRSGHKSEMSDDNGENLDDRPVTESQLRSGASGRSGRSGWSRDRSDINDDNEGAETSKSSSVKDRGGRKVTRIASESPVEEHDDQERSREQKSSKLGSRPSSARPSSTRSSTQPSTQPSTRQSTTRQSSKMSSNLMSGTELDGALDAQKTLAGLGQMALFRGATEERLNAMDYQLQLMIKFRNTMLQGDFISSLVKLLASGGFDALKSLLDSEKNTGGINKINENLDALKKQLENLAHQFTTTNEEYYESLEDLADKQNELNQQILRQADLIKELMEQNADQVREIKMLKEQVAHLENIKADRLWVLMELSKKVDVAILPTLVTQEEFSENLKEMGDSMNEMLDRIVVNEELLNDHIMEMLDSLKQKLNLSEFDTFKDAWTKDLDHLKKILYEIVGITNGEEDAAFLKLLKFHCASCDRPVRMVGQPVAPALPAIDGLNVSRSAHPFTIFDQANIRRSIQNNNNCRTTPLQKKNLDNFSKAVFNQQQLWKSRKDKCMNKAQAKDDAFAVDRKRIIDNDINEYYKTTGPGTFADIWKQSRKCGGEHTKTISKQKITEYGFTAGKDPKHPELNEYHERKRNKNNNKVTVDDSAIGRPFEDGDKCALWDKNEGGLQAETQTQRKLSNTPVFPPLKAPVSQECVNLL